MLREPMIDNFLPLGVNTTVKPTAITFATVVYSGDLAFLKMQAKSFAKFVPEGMVCEIFVAVNDRKENKTVFDIEQIINSYGPHKNKVKILTSKDTMRWSKLDKGNQLISFVNKLKVLFPLLRKQKLMGGWKANSGWLTQQAMKLAFGRHANGKFTVILDAKNIWLKPLVIEDFVSEDGKAKAEFIEGVTGKNQKAWLEPSFNSIGAILDPALVDKTTHFLTPYVVPTQILKGALLAFEAHNRSLQEGFLLRNPHPTEFFVINAYVYNQYKDLTEVFVDGLTLCEPFPAAIQIEKVDAKLKKVFDGSVKCVAIHSLALSRMTGSQLNKIYKLFFKVGLIQSEHEFEGFKLALNPDVRSKKNAFYEK